MCLLRLEFFGLGVQRHGGLDLQLGLRVPSFRRGTMRILACAACLFASVGCAVGAIGQTAPSSPDHPWHTAAEQKIEADAKGLRDSRFSVDPNKTHTLAELVDLAEAHNPQTRLAWERARAQAATLGIARSELYPTLAAVALSETDRSEILIDNRFVRQTTQDFEVALELNYTIFDFGARRGRINASSAEVLATNFAFNDVH